MEKTVLFSLTLCAWRSSSAPQATASLSHRTATKHCHPATHRRKASPLCTPYFDTANTQHRHDRCTAQRAEDNLLFSQPRHHRRTPHFQHRHQSSHNLDAHVHLHSISIFFYNVLRPPNTMIWGI